MDSQQFVTWLEQKLHAVGVEKFVPAGAALAEAYQHQRHMVRVQQAIDAALRDLPSAHDVPADLDAAVRAWLRDHPTMAWDAALAELARAADADDENANEDED